MSRGERRHHRAGTLSQMDQMRSSPGIEAPRGARFCRRGRTRRGSRRGCGRRERRGWHRGAERCGRRLVGDDAQWSRRRIAGYRIQTRRISLVGTESGAFPDCSPLTRRRVYLYTISPQIETRNDRGPLSTMGCGEKDCDGTDGHGHGHGHGGDAHAHGHSHGDSGGDAAPLIQDGEGKDGIVYYRAPDGRVLHSHDGLKPHSHDPIPSPGHFERRRPRKERGDYDERAFTVGIGGPVGTGKTALMLQLCRHFTKESRETSAP